MTLDLLTTIRRDVRVDGPEGDTGVAALVVVEDLLDHRSKVGKAEAAERMGGAWCCYDDDKLK